MQPPTSIRLVLAGSSGVGKTALLNALVRGSFPEATAPTIGIQYFDTTLKVGGVEYPVQLWDTAGQERFRAISKAYFRSAEGILLVYDITSRDSFDELPSWLDDINSTCDEVPIVLVGNKSDLDKMRQVDYDEALEFAANRGYKIYEVSARNGGNISESFYELSLAAVQYSSRKNDQATVEIKHAPEEKGKKKECGC